MSILDTTPEEFDAIEIQAMEILRSIMRESISADLDAALCAGLVEDFRGEEPK